MRLAVLIFLASRTAAASPEDLAAEPIVLPAGALEARLVVESSFATGQLARPLSFAPDAWWGATDRLTLGVVHSDASLDRVEAGASLCFHDQDERCPHAYHGGGVDARYLAWTRGALDVAPRARLFVRDVDPIKPALALGALARWHRGRFAISGDPYLQLGLANTDRGNRAQLILPVYFAVQPACRWQLALETGYLTDLAVWRDGYHVPVALAVRARATRHLELGAQAGLTSALGPQNNAKQREAWLLVTWFTSATGS